MRTSDGKTAPRYFSLMGWSWASLGIMGVLVGLAGLLAVPGIFTLKRMLLNAEDGFSPEMADAVLPILNLWIPGVVVKLVFSGLLTYTSLMFLKAKRWAYLALMGVNYFMVVSTCAGYFLMMSGIRSTIQKIQASGLMESTGVDVQIPSVFNPLLLFVFLLVVIPFGLCAWYFHWGPVKEYFAARRSS